MIRVAVRARVLIGHFAACAAANQNRGVRMTPAAPQGNRVNGSLKAPSLHWFGGPDIRRLMRLALLSVPLPPRQPSCAVPGKGTDWVPQTGEVARDV